MLGLCFYNLMILLKIFAFLSKRCHYPGAGNLALLILVKGVDKYTVSKWNFTG